MTFSTKSSLYHFVPTAQQVHIILDNLSAHKTQPVRDFPQRHPRVQFQLHAHLFLLADQVEIWFAKIEPEVIALGIFTSVPDLARKLRRYTNAYSANTPRFGGNGPTQTTAYVLTNSLRPSPAK